MALTELVKQRMIDATKARNTLERDVLKVALGDLQMDATRKGKPLTAEEEQKVLKKMVKSMQETLDARPDSPDAGKIRQEMAIIGSLLPQTLSVEQIVEALRPVAEEVKAAGNDGMATGVAMKHLKGAGVVVEGKDVSAAVKMMRMA